MAATSPERPLADWPAEITTSRFTGPEGSPQVLRLAPEENRPIAGSSPPSPRRLAPEENRPTGRRPALSGRLPSAKKGMIRPVLAERTAPLGVQMIPKTKPFSELPGSTDSTTRAAQRRQYHPVALMYESPRAQQSAQPTAPLMNHWARLDAIGAQERTHDLPPNSGEALPSAIHRDARALGPLPEGIAAAPSIAVGSSFEQTGWVEALRHPPISHSAGLSVAHLLPGDARLHITQHDDNRSQGQHDSLSALEAQPEQAAVTAQASSAVWSASEVIQRIASTGRLRHHADGSIVAHSSVDPASLSHSSADSSLSQPRLVQPARPVQGTRSFPVANSLSAREAKWVQPSGPSEAAATSADRSGHIQPLHAPAQRSLPSSGWAEKSAPAQSVNLLELDDRELDRLAGRLFPHLTKRFRHELKMDRDRAGMVSDLGRHWSAL